jgi:hypothetical protein
MAAVAFDLDNVLVRRLLTVIAAVFSLARRTAARGMGTFVIVSHKYLLVCVTKLR